MSANELIVRRANIPPHFLLARVLDAVASRADVLARLWSDIERLSVQQLVTFGGAIHKPDDRRRAAVEVVKLLNLGLEKASTVESNHESAVNFKLAVNIITQKPADLIYGVGRKMFETDRTGAVELLDRVEVEHNGIWFRLVSAHEFDGLKTVADLRHSQGTLIDHNNGQKAATTITKKMELAPFLPINDYALQFYPHWGSLRRGDYPGEFGVIDRFLLSLLIASLHRQRDSLFVDQAILWARDMATAQVHEAVQAEDEGAALEHLKHLQLISEGLKREKEIRLAYARLDPARQKALLFRVLQVTLDEVRYFVDALYPDASGFPEKLKTIRRLFIDYFEVVDQTLHLRLLSGSNRKKNREKRNILWSTLNNSMQDTIELTLREVRRFYTSISDPELASVEVVKFWDERVCLATTTDLKMTTLYNTRLVAAAEKTLEGVDAEQLCQRPSQDIVAAVGSFRYWASRDQAKFCACFNPNVMLTQDRHAYGLLKVMRSLSPQDLPGWGDRVTVATLDSTELLLETSRDPSKPSWVAAVMAKVAWSHMDPDLIVQMWEQGSDEIREIILRHQDEIKASMPSLRSYYIYDHQDTRLLAAVLKRLIHEDKLTARSTAWPELLRLARNHPGAKHAIEEAAKAAKQG